jgi:hypothetical protein
VQVGDYKKDNINVYLFKNKAYDKKLGFDALFFSF